jgi:hypothetical protein
MFLKSSLQVVSNMRTIQQHENRRAAMIARLKSLTAPSKALRAEPSLAGDMAGIAALFLMLFAALALPGAA